MRKKNSRKAVSPVIATVILVAVAITVSVAVSYWMGGISSQYTKFEKVEIQSATCTLDSPGNWTVTIKMKNTGTATSTLIGIFLNELEIDNYETVWVDAQWNSNMNATQPITSGDTKTIQVYIDADRPLCTLSSGTTVNIKVHSAGGMDYIKLIELV